MRDADEVAAGVGRTVHRRVGQQHVHVGRRRQIDRKRDVNVRALGHHVRRAVHRHGRKRVEDEEVGGTQGDAGVEGGERDAVRRARAIRIHISVSVEAVDENTNCP